MTAWELYRSLTKEYGTDFSRMVQVHYMMANPEGMFTNTGLQWLLSFPEEEAINILKTIEHHILRS